MNLVKLINIICSVSFCCSLERNDKTGDNDSNSSVILRHKREPRLPNCENQLNNENIKLRFDLNDIIVPKIIQHKKKIDKSVLLRQKRGLPVSNGQNKLNNDSIKLRLDLNNFLPKISHQGPHIIQKPITNLRAKPRPVAVLTNRINPANRGVIQPNIYNSIKNIPTLSLAPPKQNAETKPVISVTTNITKSAPEQNNVKFYIEMDDDVKVDKNPDTDTPKPTLQSRLKESVLTKLKEECSDDNKDKNGVIIGIMRELPDMIKTVMTDTVKSEGNPIIIKNITEINLPIQRGSEIKIDTQVSDSIKKEIQTDRQHSNKTENLNTKTDNSHCEEVMNLLLKPILQDKQNNAEVPHSLSHVSLAENAVLHPCSQVPPENNAENEIESIEIIQNKYSEIVEQKHETIVNKTEETEKHTEEENIVPYTISLQDDPNTVSNFYQNVYNSDTTYIPSAQEITHTTNTNAYNTVPMYSTPGDMFSNIYTPNKIYGKSPYEYSEFLQSFNMDNALCKPKYSLATDNGPQYIGASSFDDNKNTKWKTWSNTEIVIKTNHNHADWQNQGPTMMQNRGHPFYNGCNYCYFQKHVLPTNRNNPCYVCSNYYPAYQESLSQKTPDQVIASEYF